MLAQFAHPTVNNTLSAEEDDSKHPRSSGTAGCLSTCEDAHHASGPSRRPARRSQRRGVRRRRRCRPRSLATRAAAAPAPRGACRVHPVLRQRLVVPATTSPQPPCWHQAGSGLSKGHRDCRDRGRGGRPPGSRRRWPVGPSDGCGTVTLLCPLPWPVLRLNGSSWRHRTAAHSRCVPPGSAAALASALRLPSAPSPARVSSRA